RCARVINICQLNQQATPAMSQLLYSIKNRFFNCLAESTMALAAARLNHPWRMTYRGRLAKLGWVAGLGVAFVACRATPPEGVPTIPLPDGTAGIGFDDLRFSPALGKVLAPAGRSGYLDLIDPVSRSVTAIDGFSKEIFWFGGSQDGVTSVDED